MIDALDSIWDHVDAPYNVDPVDVEAVVAVRVQELEHVVGERLEELGMILVRRHTAHEARATGPWGRLCMPSTIDSSPESRTPIWSCLNSTEAETTGLRNAATTSFLVAALMPTDLAGS